MPLPAMKMVEEAKEGESLILRSMMMRMKMEKDWDERDSSVIRRDMN